MSLRHPEPATLEAYACGALASGARAVVSIHVKHCAACRAEIARLESVGGALLAEEPPAALAPEALARALAALEAPPRLAARLDLKTAMSRGGWLAFPGGLAVKRLRALAAPGERVVLIRARPGTSLPHHGHRGPERLVVLQGAFEDDLGRYDAGDLSERGPEDLHQPVACPGETCICLSASEGPLKLTGVARLLQPLLGL